MGKEGLVLPETRGGQRPSSPPGETGHQRVLHLIRPRPAGEVGGADLHIADLAEAQARRGDDVAVLSLGNSDYAELVRVRGVDTAVVHGSARSWYRGLRDVVAGRRADIVHSHGYRADILAATLRFSYRGDGARPAFVMSCHGFVRTGLAFRVLTRINEWCLRSADLIIAASAAEANRLAVVSGRTVRFIPNGIRMFVADRAVRPLERHEWTIGFVGRMAPEKRPDLFLRMAQLLMTALPEATFLLVGGGPQATAMRNLADRLGLAGRVRFTGHHADVISLLDDVDVLVCSSDTEGTPRAVIEAMAAGIPVVATRVGGLPDLIADGRTGILVPPGSAEHLAEAVIRLTRDRATAQRIGSAAALRARRDFTVERMERSVALAYVAARQLARGAVGHS
jgi:glycosyltransferase involved in cell wall biosynthesis